VEILNELKRYIKIKQTWIVENWPQKGLISLTFLEEIHGAICPFTQIVRLPL
jgi:hypothetical protein